MSKLIKSEKYEQTKKIFIPHIGVFHDAEWLHERLDRWETVLNSLNKKLTKSKQKLVSTFTNDMNSIGATTTVQFDQTYNIIAAREADSCMSFDLKRIVLQIFEGSTNSERIKAVTFIMGQMSSYSKELNYQRSIERMISKVTEHIRYCYFKMMKYFTTNTLEIYKYLHDNNLKDEIGSLDNFGGYYDKYIVVKSDRGSRSSDGKLIDTEFFKKVLDSPDMLEHMVRKYKMDLYMKSIATEG